MRLRVLRGLSHLLLAITHWSRCSVTPILQIKLRFRERKCPSWGHFLTFTSVMFNRPHFQSDLSTALWTAPSFPEIRHKESPILASPSLHTEIIVWLPLELQCQAFQGLSSKPLIDPLCSWTFTDYMHPSLWSGFCLEEKQTAALISAAWVLGLPQWQCGADHVSKRTRTLQQFRPLGSQHQSLAYLCLSPSKYTFHLGAYVSLSWPLLNQDIVLQKQCVTPIVCSQQDCKGHPRLATEQKMPNISKDHLQTQALLFLFFFCQHTDQKQKMVLYFLYWVYLLNPKKLIIFFWFFLQIP